MNLDIVSAFDLQSNELIAFVGGGGKTSLMFALARALPGRVVTTTTTRIFAAQIKSSPAVWFLSAENADQANNTSVSSISAALDQFGQCLVVGQVGSGKDKEKAVGVPPDFPGQLLARPDVDFVLVEADGSRMRPIKAPATHEPVIPPEATLVVLVVGIDALNGRIADVAHRPELVCLLIGEQYTENSQLNPEAIAALLTHPQGGLKGVPKKGRVIPFINKVETADQLVAARQIAQLTLHSTSIAQVIIGATKTAQPIRELHQRVTAVILAAGQSKRMGQTKQLLPWGNTTILGQVIRNLKRTAVHNILVVTGHEAEKVAEVAAAEEVATVFNPHFADGEMLSSLQTAVAQLPDNIAAVLVMLADQPMVEPIAINRLLEAYWQQKSDLIAPVFEGQRGNPVLIGRSYFDELLALPQGSAPRHLVQQHESELHLVEMGSNSVLRDLDNPGDYDHWQQT